MTDRNPDRPIRDGPDDVERRETIIEVEPEPGGPDDDRGGIRDTAPNPHDREGTTKTAARTAGVAAGMFLPAVIIAIIALAIILYFVFFS